MQLTRRSLLIAAGGLALAGCRHTPTPKRPALPADLGAIDGALLAERELLARYDAAVARLDAVAATALSRARDRHELHVAALESARPAPTPSASSTTQATTSGGHLEAALRESVHALQAAAVAAVDGKTAALLASIAAEHAGDAATETGR